MGFEFGLNSDTLQIHVQGRVLVRECRAECMVTGGQNVCGSGREAPWGESFWRRRHLGEVGAGRLGHLITSGHLGTSGGP